MSPGPIGLMYVAIFAVLLPWRVLRARRSLDTGARHPPTLRLLRGTLFIQLGMLVFGLAVAQAEWLDLLPPSMPTASGMLFAMLALGLFTLTLPVRWRGTPAEGRRRLAHAVPHNGREMALWVPIALCAGFGEELNDRGVLVSLLYMLTGRLWAAALPSALAFSLAHATQGWRKVGWILLFAAIVHGLVLATGSLYLAMAVHAVYDLIAGVFFGRLTRGLRTGASTAGAGSPDSPGAALDSGPRPASRLPGASRP